MWIYTTFGQLSIVEHWDKPRTMIIRSREQRTIERAHQLTTPATRGDVTATPDADYQYRYECSIEAFQGLLIRLAEDVAYPNFKNACAAGHGSNEVYNAHLHKVWEDWHWRNDSNLSCTADDFNEDDYGDDFAWL